MKKKDGTDWHVFNISILAAFKMMKAEPNRRLAIFDLIQGAEDTLAQTLNDQYRSVVAIKLCDTVYRKDACRHSSFWDRHSGWNNEKQWDDKPIEKRIEIKLYGGKW